MIGYTSRPILRCLNPPLTIWRLLAKRWLLEYVLTVISIIGQPKIYMYMTATRIYESIQILADVIPRLLFSNKSENKI